MAMSTFSDAQLRAHELLWFIEREMGMQVVDKMQDGTLQPTPFLDKIVRDIYPASAGATTTAYADYNTLLGTYWTYRKGRQDAGL